MKFGAEVDRWLLLDVPPLFASLKSRHNSESLGTTGDGERRFMPAGSQTLDKARALLEQRRKELHEELRQVETALSGLGAAGRKGPGRPPGSGAGRTKGPKRRRRGGTRADQAVKIINSSPDGIGVAEVAKQMKLNAPNYLYRVLPELEAEGKIRKQGSTYFPGS